MGNNFKKYKYFESYFSGRKYQVLNRIGSQLSTEKHFKRKKYFDKKIMEVNDGTIILSELVKTNKPFMVGRFGATECRTFVRYLEIQMGIKKNYGGCLDDICIYSGFFPRDEKMLNNFNELMADLYSEVDLLCVMNSLGEDFVVENYCKSSQLTRLEVVDPLITNWTQWLKGKKVLVIHPMANTIESQYYEKREKIFTGTDILPEFQLQTVKAVQTIAGEKDDRFDTWFDALDYMIKEIEQKDFDIALIGAGAYGFPLAAQIKRMGKQAIHMGGCLQLLFGIKGSRWDNQEYVQNYVNSCWVRPSLDEIPKKSSEVENGCYW